MKKTTKIIVKITLPRIVAIIVLVGLGIGQMCNCGTLAVTAIKLSVISDNISYTEEAANTSPMGWNDESKEEYEELTAKRTALIDSSDSTVSKFASSNHLQRFGQFLIPFASMLILFYAAVMLLPSTIRSFRRINKELAEND